MGRAPRMRRRGSVAAVVSLAFWVPILHADAVESPEPRFKHLTVADGLSDSRLRAVLQDRRGFLWICTYNGLDRYDGLGIRTFRRDAADPASLAPGFPFSLAEDREGRLWVGVSGGGVSRFDPSSERFTTFRHDPADGASLVSNDVEKILIAGDGAVWVATRDGLDRLDPASGRATHFQHDPSDPDSLSDDEVTSLLEDREGSLWVGTGGGGLNRLVTTGERPRFERWRHDPKDPTSLSSDDVRALAEDADGRLWVGTWDAGLNRLDADGSGFARPDLDPSSPLRAGRIVDLLRDRRGVLWVATWGSGLHRLDSSSGRITRYRHDPIDRESLSHSNVVSLFEDRSGLLWVGTAGGGLNLLDLKGKGFRRHRVTGELSGGLRSGDIRALAQDRAGDIWVGTAGGGLHRLDRSGRVVERFRNVPSDPGSLADDDVWALLEDRRGTLWVGTFGGLDRFESTTRRFVHHKHDPRDPGSLSSDTVYALHEDAAGRLWVGTWSGLNRHAGPASFVHYRIRPGAKEGPAPDPIVSIASETSGTLWLGAAGRLYRMDGTSGAVGEVEVRPETRAGSGQPQMRLVKRDAKGTLWVGTGSGLARVAYSAAGEPELHPLPVDLIGASIVSIELAGEGELWLGTTKGLIRCYVETGDIRRYDGADGLPGGSFNHAAALRTPDGELYFGAAEGLTSFRPDSILHDDEPPPVVLTGLRLASGAVPVGSALLPRALPETSEIRLPASEHVLSFEFASLSFRAPIRNRYRYRLRGFDGDWNELAPGRHDVGYTNLGPGSYLFQVIASNGDGTWNRTGARLGVTVLPPWWGTWWFRSIALIAVAGLLLAGHRTRIRALHARSERLEREVQERRQTEEALARSERQLRLIADALPVLIGYVGVDGRCAFANVIAEKLSGRLRAGLVGQRLDELLPARLLAQVREPVARALAGQSESFEIDLKTPEGQHRRVSIVLVPHADGDSGVRGFFALAQDITDRVRIEQASRRQQERLAHASRVLALGELAAAIAHELNQPLTAILSNAQASIRVRSGGAAAEVEDLDEVLQDIADDATRAGEIIRRLRVLARRGEAQRVPLDLAATIRSLEPLLHAGALEQDVALKLELDGSLPCVQGDPVEIQQVVLNLAGNAMEALRAAPRGERQLSIRSRQQDSLAVVEVVDNGPPLDDGVLSRLFEPFYTTKSEGLGMGLAISRSIVEAHGGQITAARNPGGGLTIRLTLPLERAAR